MVSGDISQLYTDESDMPWISKVQNELKLQSGQDDICFRHHNR
jgi:hypothetical protein